MTDLPHPAPRSWPRSLLLVLVGVGGLVATLLFARLNTPQEFYGTAYPAGRVAPTLSGTGEDGRPLALGALKGSAVAVFFGFLQCPAICPTTLASLERVRQALPPGQRDRFQTLLVSVDPARDTVPKLRGYVRFFSPSARGLIIPEPQLRKTAAAWGVAYEYTDVTGLQAYQVNHTTGVYLIDPQGKQRVVWDISQLTNTARIAADVQTVLR
ncbi:MULTISPECIES: SCO family protein [Deinococcus]|mgnify:CR=1 FL=1|uniref:SCO family protein n=1 Tax=Deinococcus rufus TaxID=2136097 RepID=A0ABV7Z9K2_9DEIO|nr:SCO family protein [Deinococcus sp. AB2017081]WQE97285.1 SCO family protein [Deinococcus sp. AB2017081]